MKLTVYKVWIEHYLSNVNPPDEEYIDSNAQRKDIVEMERKRDCDAKSIKVTSVGELEMKLEDLMPSQCGHGGIKVWIKGFIDMVQYNEEGVLVPK